MNAVRRRRPLRPASEPLLHLHGAGREVRGDASYHHDCRRRRDGRHVTLQLTLAGAGFYASPRGRRLLGPGSAWLDEIPGPFQYGYSSAGGEPYELVFVSFNGSAAFRWYHRLTAEFGHVLEVGPGSAVETQMLAIAHLNQTGALPDRYVQSGLLYQLIMAIYAGERVARVTTNPRVARAVGLADARAADPEFAIATLAPQLDCSREHLARQFRAATGLSPSAYLTQRRVRLAAELLRQTSHKLEVVARRSGFSGANYLCRVFRRQVGVSPAAFRQRRWLTVP